MPAVFNNDSSTPPAGQAKHNLEPRTPTSPSYSNLVCFGPKNSRWRCPLSLPSKLALQKPMGDVTSLSHHLLLLHWFCTINNDKIITYPDKMQDINKRSLFLFSFIWFSVSPSVEIFLISCFSCLILVKLISADPVNPLFSYIVGDAHISALTWMQM